jgi:Bax protein
MKFEHGAVGLVLALVVALVGMTLFHPPAGMTAAPVAKPGLPGPAAPPPGNAAPLDWRPADGFFASPSTSKLTDVFHSLGYDFDRIRSGEGRVPRLFLAALPADMVDIRESKVRKSLFFRALLPLVLQANEELLADRRRLWHIRYRLLLGEHLKAAERLWLAMMSERYGVERDDVDALLRRVDIIPPSLALAQAAEESGWGTSRFAREGNAVYGQWTTAERKGLIPRRRDKGTTHKIKSFTTLFDSVRSYARNLNTHRSYRGFRKSRARLRRQGAPIDGILLAGQLIRYSARQMAYVETIRGLIKANNLHRLDDSRLRVIKPDRKTLI